VFVSQRPVRQKSARQKRGSRERGGGTALEKGNQHTSGWIAMWRFGKKRAFPCQRTVSAIVTTRRKTLIEKEGSYPGGKKGFLKHSGFWGQKEERGKGEANDYA